MLRPASSSHRFSCFSSSLKTASAFVALALFCAAAAQAQVVKTYDFEDGTAQGWQAFVGTAPVNTTAAAYSGTHSILTSTNASAAGGPSIDLTSVLQAGAKYTITGWVRLTPGETATNANFTVKRTDPTCANATCYDNTGPYTVAVSDSGWAQIGGEFDAAATETALTLYAQLVGATGTQSFYLDDVVITQIAPPPGGTPIVAYTFANSSTDGWQPFGPVQLQSTPPPIQDPTGDADALLTTNRMDTWQGPSVDLAGASGLVAGATYQVTGYVLLANADASNPTVTLSLKRTDCAGTTYSNIASSDPTSSPLSNTAWTKVQGTFSFSDMPGAPSSLVLYAQSSSATDSFYLAHVTVNQLTAAPPDPSQQDNSGISSTFEDGGLDGWGSRSGSSVLTNATDTAHSGTHSLLVTNRVANWDGPSISVDNKMYVGSVYNISAWVRLQPTDGSTHTINMSLQTVYQGGKPTFPSITPYPGISVPADGNWHQVSVKNYTMGSNYDPGQASLYLQTVGANGSTDLVSFYVDDFQLNYVTPVSIQTDIPSIYQTYSSDFPVGAAIDSTDLSGAHEKLLTMHFNSITSGNEMKWSSIEPSLGTFNWAPADAEVGEAVCHSIRIRGHNLVWASGSQTPTYAFGDGTNSAANQALVTGYIQEHIRSEVQHFGNKVYAWDVVNEPLDPHQPDCLLHGPFYNVLGPEYLDVAFRAARQYAPNAKLFLNDYSTADSNRLACLVKVVGDLQSRGVPIDGVGHEMHNAINYPSPAAMANAIDTVAKNFPGIDQQVTELDESVYNAGDYSNYGNNVPPAILAEQGWLYKAYFDLFRAKAQEHELGAVTIWGMADDDTWLDSFPVARTDYPLPFDMKLQAKPAYWGIVDPTHLPGAGMTFHLTTAEGTTGHVRLLTITATNGDVGPAYGTQINSLTLTRTSGVACTPKITAGPALPVVLGDIPTSGSASA
ncbi:MAG TPA: endo-1,4-beta-xylanase, partial [Acidobacteriaceae bacterium]|nr:endo-1,4-beta-xylanase [Acidobacteriaceae bacterium]